MRLVALLVLATLLVGMAGCMASPEADPTEDPGSGPSHSPVPGYPVTLILQTPVAERLVGPEPAFLTMAEAREVLPFPVETPGFLPNGFIAEELVAVTLQPPRGEQPGPNTAWRPVGVRFRYTPHPPTPGDIQRFIIVEQSLLSGKPEVLSSDRRVVPIGRHFADVWQTENLEGRTFILVAWEEIAYGTATLLTSTQGEEETLEVAWSFQ